MDPMGNEIEIDETGWASWNLVKKFSVKTRTKNHPTKNFPCLFTKPGISSPNFGMNFLVGEILAPIRAAQNARLTTIHGSGSSHVLGAPRSSLHPVVVTAHPVSPTM